MTLWCSIPSSLASRRTRELQRSGGRVTFREARDPLVRILGGDRKGLASRSRPGTHSSEAVIVIMVDAGVK